MTLTNITQGRSYKAQNMADVAANLPTASLVDVLPGQFVTFLATDTGVLYGLAYGDTAWRVINIDTNNTNTAITGSRKSITLSRLNFNAANGTDIGIFNMVLPSGFKRYAISQLWVSQPSHTMATVSCGLYAAPAAAGTAVITAFTPAATVTTDATTHNLDGTVGIAAITVAINTASYSLAGFPKLYLNLVTQEGATCVADVTLEYVPLP